MSSEQSVNKTPRNLLQFLAVLFIFFKVSCWFVVGFGLVCG
ncbi:putative membrane protein [Synechococcus sp. SYN20]|nr:putative membrane protein [Synechococcus sp. SYN20]